VRFCIIIIFLLSGCDQGKQEFLDLGMSLDDNNCLVRDNSDITIEYSTGDNLFKNLIWSCSQNSNSQYFRVERFFVFDNEKRCYVSPELVFGNFIESETDCEENEITPNSVSSAVEIESFTSRVEKREIGDYWYEYGGSLRNSGNITLFGLKVKQTITSETAEDGAAGSMGPLEPIRVNDTLNAFGIGSSCSSCQSGTILNAKIEVLDYYDNLINEQIFDIEIP